MPRNTLHKSITHHTHTSHITHNNVYTLYTMCRHARHIWHNQTTLRPCTIYITYHIETDTIHEHTCTYTLYTKHHMYTDTLHTTHLQWVGTVSTVKLRTKLGCLYKVYHTLVSALPWAWHRRTNTPGKGSPFSVEVALSFLLSVNSSGIGAASCSQMCSGSWQLQREGAGKGRVMQQPCTMSHSTPYAVCNQPCQGVTASLCMSQDQEEDQVCQTRQAMICTFYDWQDLFPVAQGKPLIKLRGRVAQRSWAVAPLRGPLLCLMIDNSRPSWDGFRRPGSGKTSLSKGPGSPSYSGRLKSYWKEYWIPELTLSAAYPPFACFPQPSAVTSP